MSVFNLSVLVAVLLHCRAKASLLRQRLLASAAMALKIAKLSPAHVAKGTSDALNHARAIAARWDAVADAAAAEVASFGLDASDPLVLANAAGCRPGFDAREWLAENGPSLMREAARRAKA